MGWLIVLGVLILLALLPLGADASYDEQGLEVRLVLGPLRILLYPPKKKKPAKEKTAKKEKKNDKEKKPEKTKKGGSYPDFLRLLKFVRDLLLDFRKKAKMDILEMQLTLAGGDPCDLAVNYGRAWAALGNLMPQLERLFVIRKRNLNVACDFTDDQTRIYVRTRITMTVWHVLCLVSRYGIRVLKEIYLMKKKSKGGANV